MYILPEGIGRDILRTLLKLVTFYREFEVDGPIYSLYRLAK